MKQQLIISYIFVVLGIGLSTTSCGTHKAAQVQPVSQLTEADYRRHDYYFLEATRQREAGNHADALALYEHCLSINPQSAAVMYELAQYYAFLQQPERSRVLLEKAVELQPDNFWYRQTLGAYYRSIKEMDKAIAVYEEMSTQFPARGELLMMLMDLYSQQKDYPNLIKTLDRLEVKEGKSEQLSMEKYRIYLQMGDKENAFREMENLSKEYPNDVRYRVMLGDSYLDNERPDEAYAIFQAALAEDPENAQAQLSMASYYERMGMDSLFYLQQEAVLMNSKLGSSVKAEVMRRIILQNEQTGKDSTRVLQLFDRMLSVPQEDATIATLCYSYMQHKQMDDSVGVPVLEKILEVEPDNIAARYSLLMVAVRKNDYAEAVRICEPAIQYNPEELAFYYYLGISYFQVERNLDALAVLQKGVTQVTPESDKKLVSDFYTFIGDLHHSMEKQEACYEAYDSALVYNPDNIGVLNNYAYFLSLERRNLDKAEEMSFRTVKAEPKNDTYLDTYAWILFEKERYTEARIYIDEAMKNGGGESATIVEHSGDIYYMLGEVDKALEFWKQAAGMEHESATLERKIKLKKYIKE
ncbi:MAG: tetratricopeptide repeat protein [Bacteroidaceae bacterium]|nr:tetratricopeptide repeat protein [Bacteroidaceae bacterium]MBR3759086.1 tetratricopeptide repeat protein [Bacteroidaceae bacterium]